jgi:hypothetical protein
MLFNPKCEQVVFISLQSIPKKDKSGNFSLVTVADPTTYENVAFFPENADDFKGIERGELINVELNCSGRFNSLVKVS